MVVELSLRRLDSKADSSNGHGSGTGSLISLFCMSRLRPWENRRPEVVAKTSCIALPSEGKGRVFESRRARHDFNDLVGLIVTGANFRATAWGLGRCGADKFGEIRDLGA